GSFPAGEMERPVRPLPSSSIGEKSRRRQPVGELRMSGGFEHEPVMLAEVLDAFRPVPPGWLIDATVGGGGHAEALLDAFPQHNLLGLDRDQHALDAAAATLARFGERVRLRPT